VITRSLLAQIESLQILSKHRQRAPLRGERSSLRQGAGMEYADFRPYLQGDDIRRIDWNLYARTEKLFLKLFLEEESKPVYFVVDASESMSFGEPSKFRFAMQTAACLAYISLRRYDAARLLLLSGSSFRKISIGAMKQFFPFLDRMETLVPAGETCLSAGLKKIALSRFPRGIYFVLSDFYSADGLEGMKFLGLSNEVHCLHILTPEEERPPLKGELRLIDSETKAAAEVSMSAEILRRYLVRLESFRRDVRRSCRQSMSTYLPVLTSTPLTSLLLKDLRAAGIVM
jgi:uncharacterized protein (DUF58 family)